MSDTGSAKAGFSHILDSLVSPGNTDGPSDCEKDFLLGTRARPSVSSSPGRYDARNFETELEEQENLGVTIDIP